MSDVFFYRRPDGRLVELDPQKVRVFETDDGRAYEYVGDKADLEAGDPGPIETEPAISGGWPLPRKR